MPGLEREFVFLSYAHEDLEKVRRVYEGLKERGLNVWFDKEDLKTEITLKTIERTIAHSKSYVFCLSNAALNKTSLENPGFVDEELHTAWRFAKEHVEKDFQFVVAKLEDCDRGDLRLSDHSQINLFPDLEKGLDELSIKLGGRSLSDPMAIDERTEEEKMLESMMGKGATFYYSGEYERALSIIEAIISIKPASHEAWSSKGAALGSLGRHDEALETYNKAIEIKPDFHEAWYNKGAALDSLGRPDEALEAYNRAIEIKPDDHDTWYNLSCLYSLKKEKDKALKYLQKAIENGLNDLSHIEKDNDLDFIRNEKEFQEIISKLTS